MTALNKQSYRADGGDIGIGRLKEIADNAYSDEEKRWLAQRVLSLLDELEAAERLITEWEQRELSNKRQLVINGRCESGEPFWEIDDYMKKWDAEHPREAAAAGIGVKGE